MTGVYLLVAVLVVATAFGLWRRRTDGRMRDVAHVPTAPGAAGAPADTAPARPPGVPAAAAPSAAGRATDDSEPLLVEGRPVEIADHTVVPVANALTSADLGHALGERATLVQFSSAFCTPCRATRVVLDEVARTVPGVAHVEIDAESHLELVRRLDVTRTPTVLVLDSGGRIRRRATGAPRRPDVVAALGDVV